MRGEFGLRGPQNIADADCHHHAIDGLARPVLFQQIKKGQPTLAIRFLIRILRCVAACGVNEDSVLCEPPIAIAGSAAAGDRAIGVGGNRKFQATIHQRRGLAGTRRANDEIPRQLVKEIAPRSLRSLECDQCILHFLCKHACIGIVIFRFLHHDIGGKLFN